MVFGGLSITNGLAGDLKRGAHLDEALGGERPGHPVGEADNLSACHCEEAQAPRLRSGQAPSRADVAISPLRRLPRLPSVPSGRLAMTNPVMVRCRRTSGAGRARRPVGGPVQDRPVPYGMLRDRPMATLGSQAWLKNGIGRRLKPA